MISLTATGQNHYTKLTSVDLDQAYDTGYFPVSSYDDDSITKLL